MSSASVSAPAAQRVALLGFGDFERSALVSYLRLSSSRVPAYQEAPSLASADFVIADADHAGTLDAVLGADRVADTVFIGSLAPDGAKPHGEQKPRARPHQGRFSSRSRSRESSLGRKFGPIVSQDLSAMQAEAPVWPARGKP